MLLFQLLRAPAGSRPVRADFDGLTLTPGIATTAPKASCPVSGHETQRVHSHDTRRRAEEPVLGHRVRLRMTLRRFLCPESGCPRRIFVEPLQNFAARSARTTARLAQTHLAIGWALGGEAGARLAEKIAGPTSPETLLRRVQQAGARSSPTPRLGGSDDWARCKGQRYGTIVVDLETGDVVELLPDRDAATVAAWLEAHPGVESVSRDRSSASSQAAAEAAPKAQQVADRWHLLKDVREAVERLFERHLPVITDALKPADADPGRRADATVRDAADAPTAREPTPQGALATPAPASPRREAALAERPRRLGRFEQVHELRRPATPIREIARALGLSRHAVRRDLRREHCPDWRPGRDTRPGMDAHREWVAERSAAGRINASALHRDLVSRGVRLSSATVRRLLTQRLGRVGQVRPRVDAAQPKPIPPPSPKRLSVEWVRRPEERPAEAQARLEAIRRASRDLTGALDLADDFTAVLRKHSAGTVTDRWSRAEVSACPEVRHFAAGIRRERRR